MVLRRLIYFAAIFIVVYLIYDCYYGWLDDVLVVNLFKGQFSSKPFHGEELFQIYSNLLVFLYKEIPNVPWYGILLLVLGFLSIYNLMEYILDSINPVSLKLKRLAFILLTLFYLLFFAENVILLNYNRIGILLVGSSLLWIWILLKDKEKKRRVILIFYYLFLFITGFLIRNQTAFVPMFIVCFFIFTEVLFNMKYFKKFILLITLIFTFLITHSFLLKTFGSEEYKRQREKWPYIFVLVDGQRINDVSENSNLSLKDDIRMKALNLYYYHDYEMFDIEFLEKLGGKKVVKWMDFKSFFLKIKRQVDENKHKMDGYKSGMNHINKFLFLNLFCLTLILIAFLFHKKFNIKRYIIFQMLLNYLAFIAAILFITIQVKYEDRLFTPSFVVLFFINLSIVFKALTTPEQKKSLLLILIILSLPLCLLRLHNLIGLSTEKEQEISLKRQYIKELNTKYTGKIFIHDIWTLSLLHNKPLNEMKLSKNNIHTVFADLPYHDLEFHRNYLRDVICPHDSFVGFYECAKQNNDRFIFTMLNLRVDLLEDYFKILYNKEFHFQKLYENESTIYDIKYSYLWMPLDMGFYRIK